ncbi:fungal-specific transcription factor domain-containing protein [Penicillium argentinense]|uniref:Fungal-specific transcription factor domain-containing protein n=1 Tax=Penicillium argentinense TaxID=1131581 RepID=A0A9W9KE27_9EURO|nr:fungal-specific transcription factor domain-containing protein [Penicillium argentinense]KAJ5103110.1 fungal-specific transcription factor domain-containing protein [Penicillium argentinense]
MRDYIQRKASTGATYIELESLSQTGWELQQEILAWKLSAKDPNSFNQVAMLYQQGMLIYLSGQYDYRPELGTLPANVPRRTGTEIQTHVLRILDLTPHLLNKSNFAEVMYLFPLRVAGARAVDFVTRSKVIGLARRIAERGFRVTERVLSDLQLLWRFRDSGLAPLPITEI